MRNMYSARTIYPAALASGNIVAGWLLYGLFESVLGLVLVTAGILVVFSLVGRLVSEYNPGNRSSA